MSQQDESEGGRRFERTTCLVCNRRIEPDMQHPVLMTAVNFVEVWVCWHCVERYVIIVSMNQSAWAAYRWRAIEPYVSLPKPFGLASGPGRDERA